jgi:hypothetical protein
LLVAAACAVLGAGVAGVSSARSPDPKLMVLRLSDVPVGFGIVNGYYADNVRAAKENPWVSLADFISWGRITGYGAEYQRSSSVGLVDIVSRASTYRTQLGAGQSLHDTYRFLKQQRQFVQVSMGRTTIGNDSRMYSFTTKSSGLTLLDYIVVWRWKTVKADVTGGGIHATGQPEAVIALARTQEKRIRTQVP